MALVVRIYIQLYLDNDRKIKFYTSEIALDTISNMFFNILGGCNCKDFVNENGYGNCNQKYKNKPICYVNQPTSCSDLIISSTNAGERGSWKACKGTYSYLY